MKLTNQTVSDIVIRILVGVLFGAFFYFVGMALNSPDLIKQWLNILFIATSILLFSPVRTVNPEEALPAGLSPIMRVLQNFYLPDAVRRSGILLGAVRAVIALSIGIIASLAMEMTSSALHTSTDSMIGSFIAGLVAMALVLGIVWFVVVFTLQSTAPERVLRLGESVHETLSFYSFTQPLANSPVVRRFLLLPPSRLTNAITVALGRSLLTVAVRILIQLAMPLLVIFTATASWWVAAAAVLTALLIIVPDLFMNGFRKLSENRGAYAESKVVFPEQPTPRAPAAPAAPVAPAPTTEPAPAPAPTAPAVDDIPWYFKEGGAR